MGVSENRLVPLNPMVNDHYPYEKRLFHWEYTPNIFRQTYMSQLEPSFQLAMMTRAECRGMSIHAAYLTIFEPPRLKVVSWFHWWNFADIQKWYIQYYTMLQYMIYHIQYLFPPYMIYHIYNMVYIIYDISYTILHNHVWGAEIFGQPK